MGQWAVARRRKRSPVLGDFAGGVEFAHGVPPTAAQEHRARHGDAVEQPGGRAESAKRDRQGKRAPRARALVVDERVAANRQPQVRATGEGSQMAASVPGAYRLSELRKAKSFRRGPTVRRGCARPNGPGWPAERHARGDRWPGVRHAAVSSVEPSSTTMTSMSFAATEIPNVVAEDTGMEVLAGYWTLENPAANRLKPRFRDHLDLLPRRGPGGSAVRLWFAGPGAAAVCARALAMAVGRKRGPVVGGNDDGDGRHSLSAGR